MDYDKLIPLLLTKNSNGSYNLDFTNLIDHDLIALKKANSCIITKIIVSFEPKDLTLGLIWPINIEQYDSPNYTFVENETTKDAKIDYMPENHFCIKNIKIPLDRVLYLSVCIGYHYIENADDYTYSYNLQGFVKQDNTVDVAFMNNRSSKNGLKVKEDNNKFSV